MHLSLLFLLSILEYSLGTTTTTAPLINSTDWTENGTDLSDLSDLSELAVPLNSSDSLIDSGEYVLLNDYEYYEASDDLVNASYVTDINYLVAEPSDCAGHSLLGKLSSIHAENQHLPLHKHVPHLNHTMRVIDHLVNLTSTLISVEFTQQQIGAIMEFFYTANVSDRCFLALVQVAKGIFEQRIWALKCE